MKKILTILLLIFIITFLMSAVSATDTNTTIESQSTTNIEQDEHTGNAITPTIQKDDTDNKDTKSGTESELDDETVGTGCTTTLIQGYNNDSALSFRRDATNKLTVNVKHDNSIVKQYKEGSYFFHAIVSKDGWMVGNGGADNAQVNHAIENNAITMINKNNITYENMNNIYKQESRLSLGHFVIKAPNGTYSLIIKNGGRTMKDSGVLKPGQYLIVPNSIYYYKKNSISDINTQNTMTYSSRMLAARDGYGVNRREIITYYYKNNRVNSTVTITATNDNGKYVGRRTGSLIDNIRTNTKYFSSSSIPVVDSYIKLDNINFFLRKTKTSITASDLKVKSDKIQLTATVKDEFQRNINKGKVIIKIDGKTLKYKNGSNIYVNVKDGKVRYNTTLTNLWKKKKHTYSIHYITNSVYENTKSDNANIIAEDFFKLKTIHDSYIYLGEKITIKSNVTYKDNSPINSGKIFYKINGKTVLNSKNTTLYKKVKNSKTEFNYTFSTKYWAKNYTITTVYVNGAYRKEYNTTLHIMKIPTRIVKHKVSTKKNMIYFTGKLVDKKGNPIRYRSYITVKINGKTLKTNNTIRKFNIKNGNINFKFTLPPSYRANKYTLTIKIPEMKETLSYNKNYTIKV